MWPRMRSTIGLGGLSEVGRIRTLRATTRWQRREANKYTENTHTHTYVASGRLRRDGSEENAANDACPDAAARAEDMCYANVCTMHGWGHAPILHHMRDPNRGPRSLFDPCRSDRTPRCSCDATTTQSRSTPAYKRCPNRGKLRKKNAPGNNLANPHVATSEILHDGRPTSGDGATSRQCIRAELGRDPILT